MAELIVSIILLIFVVEVVLDVVKYKRNPPPLISNDAKSFFFVSAGGSYPSDFYATFLKSRIILGLPTRNMRKRTSAHGRLAVRSSKLDRPCREERVKRTRPGR